MKPLDKPNKPSFWITNISNRNVSLTDLYLTIKAKTTVNLLDDRHYHYTKEQLEASATSGSLFHKRSMLQIRSKPPVIVEHKISISSIFLPSRERSVFRIKEETYEELAVATKRDDEEQFATANADLADLDTQSSKDLK